MKSTIRTELLILSHNRANLLILRGTNDAGFDTSSLTKVHSRAAESTQFISTRDIPDPHAWEFHLYLSTIRRLCRAQMVKSRSTRALSEPSSSSTYLARQRLIHWRIHSKVICARRKTEPHAVSTQARMVLTVLLMHGSSRSPEPIWKNYFQKH